VFANFFGENRFKSITLVHVQRGTPMWISERRCKNQVTDKCATNLHTVYVHRPLRLNVHTYVHMCICAYVHMWMSLLKSSWASFLKATYLKTARGRYSSRWCISLKPDLRFRRVESNIIAWGRESNLCRINKEHKIGPLNSKAKKFPRLPLAPASFRHPVDIFSSFCPILWQHFARHCRKLRGAYFHTPKTWVTLFDY
jgi:hypothetical protein